MLMAMEEEVVEPHASHPTGPWIRQGLSTGMEDTVKRHQELVERLDHQDRLLRPGFFEGFRMKTERIRGLRRIEEHVKQLGEDRDLFQSPDRRRSAFERPSYTFGAFWMPLTGAQVTSRSPRQSQSSLRRSSIPSRKQI